MLGRIVISILFFALRAQANVVGADTQNFNPTNDGLDFVTVHSSKTLTPGLFNFGLFLNYAVNSLPNYQDQTTSKKTNFRDSLLSSDVNFGLGLTKSWEAGVSLPAVLAQKVTSDVATYRGQFASTGATEFRLMSKVHLLGGDDQGMAIVVSGNFNQIQNNPFLGKGAGPTYNFELAGDTMIGKFQWGINAGYRLRSPGQALAGPIQPIGNQYIASTALSYLLTGIDTKIISEVFGSVPAKSQPYASDRQASTAEFLLGLKTDVSRSIAFHFGGGTELIHGTSSPDWRVYTGINWVIGPAFKKSQDAFVKMRTPQRPKRVSKIAVAPPPPPEPIDLNDPFEGTPQMVETFVARDILFEFDSDRLSKDAPTILQRLVDHLRKPPAFKTLVIEGHTDYIGTAAYNFDLSKRRAYRVEEALSKLGLPIERIRSIGFGATRPIANNGNYQGRALNRRVEFHVHR